MKLLQVRTRAANQRRAAAALTLSLLCLSSTWAQNITQTRSSSFSYLASGMLATETIEPDTPNLCVVTTHSYDSYGNKAGASTSNCAGATGLALFDTRASSATFAAQTATLSINNVATTVAIPAGTFATSSRVALTANILDTASHTESREFDPRFGTVTRLIGPNGALLSTTWQLDEFGRKVLEVRADGTRSKALFCLITGRVSDTTSNSTDCTSQTFATNEVPATAVRFEHSEPQDSAGNKIGPYARAYYDAAGRKIRTATQAFDGSAQPAGPGNLIVQDADYNAHGGVVVATQPYFLATGSSTTSGSQDVGLTRTDYDALGRSTAVYTSDPATAQQTGGSIGVGFGTRGSGLASKTLIGYSGLQSTVTDDKGRTRTEEKNPDGKVVRTTDAYGAQIVHQHDALGNLIATKDPLGNTLVVTYDVRGRKTRLQDPDAGNTDYCYDALGQLKAQQTSNMRGGHGSSNCPSTSGAGSTAIPAAGWTTLAYDRMGRLTSRVEPEYTTTWHHDKDASGNPCGPSIGKTCQSVTSHGISRKSFYDPQGRPVATRTDVTSGPSMASAVSYNAQGRLQTQTYPTGVRVRYAYTGLGYLNRISNDTQLTGAAPLAANTVLWEGQSYNAWGGAEKQSYGNGVQSRASVEPQTGRLQSLTAGPSTNTSINSIVHQRLHWNSVGELTLRVDGLGDGVSGIEIQDTYTHDAIGRLTKYQVAGNGTPSVRTVELQYNALGMLLYKTDVGIYTYPAQGTTNGRPHAVQSVAGNLHNASYGYDNNGNVVSATGGKYRSIAYTSFNLPDSNQGLQGPAGSPKYTWQYDESHARIKETRVNGAGTRTTWYLHPDNKGGLAFERDEAASGIAQNRHYVGGFAVLVTEGALPSLTATQQEPSYTAAIVAVKVEYWFKDHLGSLIATTNAAGTVTARYSYDPFGKRRTVTGSYDAFGNLVIDFGAGTAGTDRGYTGHEHLDDVGVIHMNGRIFDPTLGRFLQPDPFVQEPGNLQNYDRFMYCFGNPGTCTDPTGYFSLKKLVKLVVVVVVAIYAPYLLEFVAVSSGASAGLFVAATCSATGSVTLLGAASAGFFSGAVAGGSFKSGVQGAFSAALFFGAGELISSGGVSGAGGVAGSTVSNIEQVAIHGVAGCISSVSGGGKCGPGALSAAFSKTLAVNELTSASSPVEGVIKSAVAGGLGSMLGGGKFENGAQTGAFSYLFNCLAHGCSLKTEGYEPTKYPNGTVCNATSAACTPGIGTDQEVGKAAVALFTFSAAAAATPFAAQAIWTAGLNGGTTSVFWAGPGTQLVAEGYGGIAISQTPIGGLLAFADGFGLVSKSVWVSASTTFAMNAQGVATAVLNRPWATTIWSQTESRILAARNILVNVVTVVPEVR